MLKKVFLFIFITCAGLVLSGCGDTIKDGPAERGDAVFVEYIATFEKYPQILFATTRQDVAVQMKAPLASIYAPYRCKIGDDTLLPTVVQDALLGMKAGDTKKVLVPFAQLSATGYNPTLVKRESTLLYKNMGIAFTPGDTPYKDGHYVIVKDVSGEGSTQEVVFDMNPLETYNNVVYELTVVQVGGKEFVPPQQSVPRG